MNIVFNEQDVMELISLLRNMSYKEIYANVDDISSNQISKVNAKNNKHNSILTKDKDRILLPKVMDMYASRACRTSIMIGTTLSLIQMNKIVTNLSTIEQPWNCPHGRPTLRHLCNLNNM